MEIPGEWGSLPSKGANFSSALFLSGLEPEGQLVYETKYTLQIKGVIYKIYGGKTEPSSQEYN